MTTNKPDRKTLIDKIKELAKNPALIKKMLDAELKWYQKTQQ